ncbi:HTTM domain-containing protein [Natranaeroarchaeum aerophilus]|uniref:HTTM domain-containing protein n=1 Tax=Natranaeroarchaeum aerophilus TaxID=2917711 RepID=A0AAE3FTE3_9EURY|nr:HTTM domain-containing protein [Natranaeroarchaeum aerophilus]MCL9814876.1 HTTM domain-containing protein [Natranaeroarchaeum aerophilus]
MSSRGRDGSPSQFARVQTAVERRIRVDSRSLAAFRILAGLLVIADLLLRSRNFEFFYTESGVVPRSLARELSADYALSIYHLTTDPTLIAALFVLQGLIALQLIVGYKTRLATVLTFVFAVSLDHHNPLVLSYADTLFRFLLFWAMFLPLGERWSIDAVHRDRTPRASVASAATALVLVQVVYVYFTNGLTKSLSEEWVSGTAATLVFGIDEVTFLLGDLLREVPALLGIGGFVWYLMLLGSWLLLALVGRGRLALVGLFVAGHVSFALTVRIGAFPYVSIAGLLLFLPPVFWQHVRTLFDRARVDVDGIVASVRDLATLVPASPLIGDFDRFGLPPDRRRRLRSGVYTVTIGIVVVTIVLVSITFLFQIGTAVAADDHQPTEETIDDVLVDGLDGITGLRHVETVAESAGVDQPVAWGIFAQPRTEDRYYVFPARTAEGDLVDAYNARKVTYDRPYDRLQRQHGTYRERFYMNSVRRGGQYGNDVPHYLAEHVCEQWADEHGTELTHVNMYMISEEITRETIDRPSDRDRTYLEIYSHGCGDYGPTVIQPPDGE